MAQAILFPIIAWDATLQNALSFSYTGNQVFKNQAVIRNNLTNVIVYDQTQTSFQLKHIIAPNSLINGICYNIEIRTFDKDNVASAYSKKLIFYCYTTPVYKFSNIIPNQIILNSAYQLDLNYSQIQNEPLNNYQFVLYNEKQNEVMRSGMFYSQTDRKYTISSLSDKAQYFVQAIGQTLNGMICNTGLIPFSVRYTVPSSYAIVDIQNLYSQGMIKIRSNIVAVEGKASSEYVKFTSDNQLDVTIDGANVVFDEGFEVTGDFTLQASVRKMIETGLPIVLSDGTQTIKLDYQTGNFPIPIGNKGYFSLTVSNSVTNYFVVSEYLDLPINDTDKLNVWIRRINNIYELSVVNQGGV